MCVKTAVLYVTNAASLGIFKSEFGFIQADEPLDCCFRIEAIGRRIDMHMVHRPRRPSSRSDCDEFPDLLRKRLGRQPSSGHQNDILAVFS